MFLQQQSPEVRFAFVWGWWSGIVQCARAKKWKDQDRTMEPEVMHSKKLILHHTPIGLIIRVTENRHKPFFGINIA